MPEPWTRGSHAQEGEQHQGFEDQGLDEGQGVAEVVGRCHRLGRRGAPGRRGRPGPDHRAGRAAVGRPEQPAGRAARSDPAGGLRACARRSSTSTTSASPSGWCTPAATAPTAPSRRPPTCRRSPGRPSSPSPARRPRRSSASPPSPAPRAPFDLARDVRGFAVKLYTTEGNWDIVGNNIPVFFIQDAIKFPDLVHAVKEAPGPRLPAGPVGARQLLGLRLLHARVDPHDPVADVGPRHPAVVPVHGGLRRPHLPVRQRRRASRPS